MTQAQLGDYIMIKHGRYAGRIGVIDAPISNRARYYIVWLPLLKKYVFITRDNAEVL